VKGASCARSVLCGSVSAGALAVALMSVTNAIAQPQSTPAFPSAGVAPLSSCASLTGLSLPNTHIISATPMFAAPGYCQVVGVINQRVSTQDPDHFTYGIGFELNLPNTWTGRFELMGGGGTDGSLPSASGAAGLELSQGWAVASNDGGHEDRQPNPFGWADTDNNAGGTAHFAVDEQARTEYGYDAMAQTSAVSKEIIVHYYGRDTLYSYFWGCSNGGREGMLASERFPDIFDGIVAGNPGFDLPQAAVAEAWNEQALVPLANRTDVSGNPYNPDTFPPQDLMVASAAILSACDALDGLVDGIVDNYRACSNRRVYPALEAFTCSATGLHGNTPHGGTCLTPGQVSALKKIYAGPVNSEDELLYTDWYWDAGIWDPPAAPGFGWQAWNVGFVTPAPLVNNSANLTLGAGAVPMIFTTPPVVTPVSQQAAFLFNFNFDTQAQKIFAHTPDYPQSSMKFMAAVSHDLSPFKRHGGKMILYHGVNDGIFSSKSLVRWYDAMDRSTGDARSFTRLFLVPNMAHCGGGPATSDFSGNVLQAITDWVEAHRAPEQIIAANTGTSSPFPAGGLFDPRVAQNFPAGGTRPLCPYPQLTRYKGTGPTNVASSFVCVRSDDADGGDNDHDDGHGRD
jgi:Tannase and feruloyl esterase